MNVEESPPWSGKQLKRLGQALIGSRSSPGDHPSYEDVMGWHADLADEISSRIVTHRWSTLLGSFDVSSRAKTVDTLREKLIRESHLKLNQVQDIAGVRVDLDGHLGEQTAFCEELAEFFGGHPRAEIKDLRQQPHSGYRAVHVWLRLPAGRVEVQVRTRYQSAWANTYERLGDIFGRQIRYGGSGEGRDKDVVPFMHFLSDELRLAEEQHLRSLEGQARGAALKEELEKLLDDEKLAGDERLANLREQLDSRRKAFDEARSEVEGRLARFLDGLEFLKRSLDEGHWEAGEWDARIRD